MVYIPLAVPVLTPGIAYFAPTIIKQLGYTSLRANILSAPPWAVAFVFAMIMATISDYCAHRFLFAIVSTLIGIAGFIVRPTLYDKRPGRGRDGLRDLHWRGDLSRMGQDDRKKNGDTPGKKAEECTRIARVANEKSTVDGENHAEYTAKSCGVRLCKMRAHSMCKVEVVYGGFWD